MAKQKISTGTLVAIYATSIILSGLAGWGVYHLLRYNGLKENRAITLVNSNTDNTDNSDE